MSKVITGMFPQNINHLDLEKTLETAGITNDRYVVYLHDQNDNYNYYLTSVKTGNNHSEDHVRKLLVDNGAFKTYDFEDIDIKNPASYVEIQNTILAHSRAEIFESPEIRKHNNHEGLDSEVKF